MTQPRGYQTKLKLDSYDAWRAGAKVVMPVLATGGGKTVVMGDIGREYDGIGWAVAHRQELVGQISVQMAREGIRHRLFVPDAVRRKIQRLHMRKVGRDYTDPNASWTVGGIDTLVRARPIDIPNANRVGLLFQDEGHHVLQRNKWGKAFEMFPNARGWLPTASPLRADGAGLGRAFDGFVDALIEGPSMRWLIDNGYLTDYKVYCPTVEDLDLSDVDLGATGDMNQTKMRRAVHRSKKLVGSVVDHYLKIAPGKLGVTFAADVESAQEIAAEFRAKGVPAEVVSAKTPDDLRTSILERFEAREVLQLVNVDLFGEGFDLPAIEVVSFGRPTESWSLFCQQFGRVLRLMISSVLMGAWDTFTAEQRKAHIAASTKQFGIIIDHVGNLIRHKGPPDKKMQWSLTRREKGAKAAEQPGDIPQRICLGCTRPYARALIMCPHCKTTPGAPVSNRAPEFVDGDLQLVSDEWLRAMRGEIERIDGAAIAPRGVPLNYVKANHEARQREQQALRKTIDLWAGAHDGEDREKQKRFYLTFGMDVLTAMTLNATEAMKLRGSIVEKLVASGYDVEPHVNNLWS